MKRENRYFEVTPKVVPADRQAVITIGARFDHCRFRQDARYEVTCFPMEQFAPRQGRASTTPAVEARDGSLQVAHCFEAEQEHLLAVEEVAGDSRKAIGEFRCYSLQEDLYRCRPYRGDLHLHSCRSDGMESPGYVAAACRRIGLDFMALTDHGLYAPSLEAQQAFTGVELDLRIYPGEEVHPPDSAVHIVNFGGRFSVNALFADDIAYRQAVKAVEEDLPELPAGVDSYEAASAVWCFDRIREAGGLGVYCHPYWVHGRHYTPAGALTSWMLARQPFDAYEVIGGFGRAEIASNTLQVARYHEERARGRQAPIVGASDAHGCERGEWFGWYYTIVFSPSGELADLIGQIKQLYSVAVEAIPGEAVRPYGPFRLVKYALFLLREVFPQQDELCAEEGRLMLAHLAGDASAAEQLRRLKGRTARLLDTYWGQP